MRQILSRSMLTVAAAGSILTVTGGYATADSEAQGGAVDSPGVLSGNSISAPIEVPVNACGNTVDVLAAGNAAFGNTCGNVSHGHSGSQPGSGETAGKSGSGARQHTGFPQGWGASHGAGMHRPDSRPPGPRHADAGADSGMEPGAGSNSGAHGSHPHHRVVHGGGSVGRGGANGSPGVGSGNFLDVPVHVPVNVCGNTVDVVALLNPVLGNSCANDSTGSSVSAPPPVAPRPPQGPATPPAKPPTVNPGGPNTPVSTLAGPPRAVQDDAPVALDEPHGGESRLAYTGLDGREMGAAGAMGAGMLLGGVILYRRAGRSRMRTR
jgi:hypothetical protein